LNQILKHQTSRSHYGSKVPAVTIAVFKYRNNIDKIVVKAVTRFFLEEAFEDTKGLIRSHESNRDRQYNGQMKKDKRTNYDLQNKITNPTKYLG
jgi:hypothetical protein